MLPFACILHSQNTFFSDSLVSSATICATALFHSAVASSPDFVPTCAVLRADSGAGAQYLYASSVPDSNHAVGSTDVVLRAPFSPGMQALLADAATSTQGTSGASSPPAAALRTALSLRARSPLFLQESIRAGTAPQKHEKKERAESRNAWASLSGALLTALCFLQKHTAIPLSQVGADESSSHLATAASIARRGMIIIFSDCGADSASGEVPPCITYNVECALATATLAAVQAQMSVSCFGEAVADSLLAAASPGAARLRVLSASLGGICASRFSLQHLGLLLDRNMVSSSDALSSSSPSSASALNERARERITEQYVVPPAMLPFKRGREGDSEEEDDSAAKASEGSDGNLGWLCPRCMGVVRRSGGEGVGEEDEDAPCPYCV